jgi:DNA repair photolyase
MGLNKQRGNMYLDITHTWNPIAGKCENGCVYCSTNKFYYPVLKEKYSGELRIVENELKTNLGKGNRIFVASQNDMFTGGIVGEWVGRILGHCKKYDNMYLFQTKQPSSYKWFDFPDNSYLATTLETNRYYKELYSEECPPPKYRANSLGIASMRYPVIVTIEPILDFDLDEFVDMIRSTNAVSIYIGADSGHNNLHEPPKEKIFELISELEKFTLVKQKSNLKRLLK